jgi:hypothetical protein
MGESSPPPTSPRRKADYAVFMRFTLYNKLRNPCSDYYLALE